MTFFEADSIADCKFIFGSDAHSHGSLDKYPVRDKIFDILALCENDITNIARV